LAAFRIFLTAASPPTPAAKAAAVAAANPGCSLILSIISEDVSSAPVTTFLPVLVRCSPTSAPKFFTLATALYLL